LVAYEVLEWLVEMKRGIEMKPLVSAEIQHQPKMA